MDQVTLIDIRTVFLIVCCGAALVLALYASILIVLALVMPRRAHFVHGKVHEVWLPEPRKPVAGKPGLYSAPRHGVQ
jgi:hypothetical protein